MKDKFLKVLDMLECLDIIHENKCKDKELLLEYDVKDNVINRKFLVVQVQVILGFYEEYGDGLLEDPEEIFMYMYTNSNIMKVFRDEYGDLPNNTVKKWSTKDINRLIQDLKTKVKIKK
jgi:hypothetical protein